MSAPLPRRANPRRALPGDAEALRQLTAALGYPAATPAQARERLQRLLDADDHWLWLVADGERALGCLHAFRADRLASDSALEIGALAVDPAARRRGLGRALVACAGEQAARLQLPLRVRCDLRREPAHAFYRALGFDERKRQAVFER